MDNLQTFYSEARTRTRPSETGPIKNFNNPLLTAYCLYFSKKGNNIS